MPKRNNSVQKPKNQFNPNDTYGVFSQEMEVDTDVNEDRNRERLLDESLDLYLDENGE